MPRSSFLALLTLCACSSSLEVEPTAFVECEVDAECPGDLVCLNATRCVDSAAVDTSGTASPIAPARDALVAGNVQFAWTPAASAIAYRITVSTDPQLAAPLFDDTRQTTSLGLDLGVGTYYWRIIADTTDLTTATVETSRFGVVDGAVHVYCNDADCETLGDEIGTPQLPFRTMSRGMLAALANRLDTVRVAKRADGAPYTEALRLLPGLIVSGGFDPTFATREGRTAIAGTEATLYAAIIETPTRVEHMSFTNTATTGSSAAMQIFRCSDALVLSDVEATAATWADSIVVVRESVGASSPRISASLIHARATSGSAFPSERRLIELQAAAVALTNGTQLTGESTNSTTPHGVLSDGDSLLEVDDARITVTSTVGTGPAYGVRFRTGASRFIATQMTIDATSTGRPVGIAGAFRGSITDSSIAVVGAHATAAELSTGTQAFERSVLTALASGGNAQGVVTSQSPLVRILASRVVADAPNGSAVALQLNTAAKAVIAQSTLVAARASTAQIVIDSDANAMIASSALIGLPTSCTGAAPCRVGMRESQTSNTLYAFANNAIIGFLAADDDECAYAITTTCIPGARGGAPYFADNQIISQLSNARLDATSYRPTATSPLRAAGIDPNSGACTTTNNPITEPACGGVTHDLENRAYGAPPDIGALNASP